MATKSVEKTKRRTRASLVIVLPSRIEFRGDDYRRCGLVRGKEVDRAGEVKQYATGQQQVKKKIAIVDDELGLCKAYSTVVKSLGYDTEFVAHDGSEAVNAVLENATVPDLIIMDYRMPNLDGLEAAKRILKEKPNIRIIIASADDSVKLAVLAHGLYYLHKPFSTASLGNLIKSAIEQQ